MRLQRAALTQRSRHIQNTCVHSLHPFSERFGCFYNSLALIYINPSVFVALGSRRWPVGRVQSRRSLHLFTQQPACRRAPAVAVQPSGTLWGPPARSRRGQQGAQVLQSWLESLPPVCPLAWGARWVQHGCPAALGTATGTAFPASFSLTSCFWPQKRVSHSLWSRDCNYREFPKALRFRTCIYESFCKFT